MYITLDSTVKRLLANRFFQIAQAYQLVLAEEWRRSIEGNLANRDEGLQPTPRLLPSPSSQLHSTGYFSDQAAPPSLNDLFVGVHEYLKSPCSHENN